MESTKQEEAINELKAALAELESEEGLEMFVEGHGLQSRYFAFSWQSDELEIDYNLPYAGCCPTRTPRNWTPRGSLSTERIEIDLDDGVKVNYRKFGAALRKVDALNKEYGVFRWAAEYSIVSTKRS